MQTRQTDGPDGRRLWLAVAAVAIVLIIIVIATGCTWKQVEGNPAAYLRTSAPDKVRVTMLDGRQHVVRNPQVRNERLAGANLSLALDSVYRIERRGADGAIIAQSVAGAALGAGVFILTEGEDDR